MSDGPHRSLPMRRSWQRVAERGDKSAFAIDEIGAALIPALEQDCRSALSADFLESLTAICIGQQNLLFQDRMEPQLESLRRSVGLGIERIVLDHAVKKCAQGKQGMDLAVGALTDALSDHAGRGARQVEEHYFRNSSMPRAFRVRERIEQAIGASMGAIAGLARRILGLDTGRSTRQPLRQQGLDDGVKL